MPSIGDSAIRHTVLLHTVLLPLALFALTACHSPFGKRPPEEGPGAGDVGRGIHGWPVLESAPHGAGWRTDVLWPAYSQIRTPGDGLQQTDVLFPLFHVSHEGDERRTGLLRPLFDLATDDEGTFDLDVVWPLVKWRDSAARQERRFWPLYRHRWDADSWDREFLHVWRAGETVRKDPAENESYLHVWPLFGTETDGSEESTWVASGLYRRKTDPDRELDETGLLGPLVEWSTEGQERHTRVLPFFWHREDIDVAPPRPARPDGEPTAAVEPASEGETILFPFWWHTWDREGEFSMLFPLLGSYESDDGESWATSVGGPLYVGGQDEEKTWTWLAAPLVHWSNAPDEWDFHLFPVLWLGGDERGGGHAHLWPLYGHHDYGLTDRHYVAAPFFQYTSKQGEWELDAPWPLVQFAADEDGGSSRVFPLYSHESDAGKTDGDVLFFVSTWESDEEADEHDFRILWRLVESTRSAGKDTFVVNPLFRHETNDRGDSHWSFLFGLIGRTETQGETDWRWLWLL